PPPIPTLFPYTTLFRSETRGDFVLRDQEVRFRGSLDSLSTLLAGSPSQVAVRLTGEPIEATYEGTISTAPVTRLAGALDVKAGRSEEHTSELQSRENLV